MAAFDVRTTTTPVDNPKSNTGQRFHRTMKRKLTALIHEFDDEWDEALPATLLAMRTSVNRTTGFTPFFLEHGREPRLPVDMIAGPPPGQATTLDCYTEKLKVQFAKAFAVVAERQNSYVLRQKELYRERHHKINIDDWVWLYTDRPNPNLNRKFQSFWSGPYRVIRNLANTLFEIESYGRWTKEKIVTTAAVDRLKKCFVADPDTNLGIPVELTAANVRPYFEYQELLGRLPASDFAPHLFDEGQQLPFSLPFSLPLDRPEEGQQEQNRLEQSREPVPVAVEKPAPAPLVPKPTPAPEQHAPQPPADSIPPQELTVPAEQVPEPPLPRRRGRPPGSKNKPCVCPNCTATYKCVAHCEFCKGGLACDSHNA